MQDQWANKRWEAVSLIHSADALESRRRHSIAPAPV